MRRYTIKGGMSLAGVGGMLFSACQPGPELHLHDGMGVAIEMPIYSKSIDELWSYDLSYKFGVPATYHWQNEWIFGWDETDERNNGPIGYKPLRQYQIRRYYQGSERERPHDHVRADYCLGNLFRSTYNFGFYDILLWNDPDALDGVDSNHFEELDLDNTLCYTNASMTASRYDLSTSDYAYYAPDELFSAYQQGLFISRDPKDYDGYDETAEVFTKRIDFNLEPRTYIYLTQLIIYNNQGRVTATGGIGTLSGMARAVNVNTGISSRDAISVTYSNRMKQDITYHGTSVDVVGGRLVTFGICGINANSIEFPPNDEHRHYMDVNLIFYNGCDTTLVFDVTDRVLEHFRGGVVTFEVDMDTIPIPKRGGGSGFNAAIGDYDDGGTHEIPI